MSLEADHHRYFHFSWTMSRQESDSAPLFQYLKVHSDESVFVLASQSHWLPIPRIKYLFSKWMLFSVIKFLFGITSLFHRTFHSINRVLHSDCFLLNITSTEAKFTLGFKWTFSLLASSRIYFLKLLYMQACIHTYIHTQKVVAGKMPFTNYHFNLELLFRYHKCEPPYFT